MELYGAAGTVASRGTPLSPKKMASTAPCHQPGHQSGGCAMLNRRDLLLGTAAATIVPPLLSSELAQAQGVDLLKVFVPAAPGGGGDPAARTIEQVLRTTGAVKGVQITNVGGAGGAVGLPQFLNNWRGQGNALMVAGMVMVGSPTTISTPVKSAAAKPVARLTGEFLALVV